MDSLRAGVLCNEVKFCARGGKRREVRERENDVKCINGVKEEMAVDFNLCNMVVQDRETFDQLYEHEEETEIKEAQQWMQFISFPACTGYNAVHFKN